MAPHLHLTQYAPQDGACLVSYYKQAALWLAGLQRAYLRALWPCRWLGCWSCACISKLSGGQLALPHTGQVGLSKHLLLVRRLCR